MTTRHLQFHVLDDLSFEVLTIPDTGDGTPPAKLPAAEAQRLAEGRAALWLGKRSLFDSKQIQVERNNPEQIVTVLGRAEKTIYGALTPVKTGGVIHQTLTVERYSQWLEAVFLQWEFKNVSSQPISFDRLAYPTLKLDAGLQPDSPTEPPWTFQGAAVRWGQDFAFPLPKHFSRDNFLGSIQDGEGGGIPLAYCWNRKNGLALAHIERQPKECYLPVRSDPRSGIRMSLEQHEEMLLQPGESLQSLKTMVSTHSGDFFAPLALYREVMAIQGLKPAETNTEDFEPAWCSWGYEFDVRPEEMIGVIPAVRELGLHWLTLDDRWFDRYGDWNPRPETFPGGKDQISRMVREIHQAGMYAQIWWYPLAVEDGIGSYANQMHTTSEILRLHPDWLILNKDGTPARNNRSLAVLCPALPGVQEYITRLIQRFIQDWGFDGHKLDNIYTVPCCHNPTHHHQRPEESVEALAEVYRIIFETTRGLKPHSVTQICPCGTPPTFSLLPFMDQAVTADPTSSAQIRQRTKFYKALLGSRAAVFSDHIELSDGGVDFASEIGTGGIPSTKFVWPEEPYVRRRLHQYHGLTQNKKSLWKRWFSLYQQYHLSEGEYMNLYDLGHDIPESHAIQKDGRIYFAFYAGKLNQTYQGKVILRGLAKGQYHLRDYVNDKDYGIINGPEASLEVEFHGSLLVEAVPEDPVI